MNARRALVGALATATLAAAAAPALAHTELVSTSPAKGAVVKHLPSTIRMNFTEAPQRLVSTRVLRAGSKTNHRTAAKLNPRNARQVVITTTGDQVGSYTVIVRLVAPDGDTQVVHFAFKVKR